MDFQLLKETCRICLEEDEPSHLIHPCLCSGTIKYVHPHCLRNEKKCSICNYEYQIEDKWYETYIRDIATTPYAIFLLFYGLLFLSVEFISYMGTSIANTSIHIIQIPLYEFICYCLMNIPCFIIEWFYCITHKRGRCLTLVSQLCIMAIIFSIRINVIVFSPLICGIYIETSKYLYSKHIPTILNRSTEIVL